MKMAFLDISCDVRTVSAAKPIRCDITPALPNLSTLSNCLLLEESYQPNPRYFSCIQKHIRSFMREVVTQWMSEVVDELRCPAHVLPLSVNLMDRYLSCHSITRNEFQLLATTCILIGSKLREKDPVRTHDLLELTDNAYVLDNLLKFEHVVLNALRWDTNALVANDFLDLILARLSFVALSAKARHAVEKIAPSIIALCVRETSFMIYVPSMVASGAIILSAQMEGFAISLLTSDIIGLTKIDMDTMKTVLDQMREMVECYRGKMMGGAAASAEESPTGAEGHSENTTPTDLCDIDLAAPSSHNRSLPSVQSAAGPSALKSIDSASSPQNSSSEHAYCQDPRSQVDSCSAELSEGCGIEAAADDTLVGQEITICETDTSTPRSRSSDSPPVQVVDVDSKISDSAATDSVDLFCEKIDSFRTGNSSCVFRADSVLSCSLDQDASRDSFSQYSDCTSTSCIESEETESQQLITRETGQIRLNVNEMPRADSGFEEAWESSEDSNLSCFSADSQNSDEDSLPFISSSPPEDNFTKICNFSSPRPDPFFTDEARTSFPDDEAVTFKTMRPIDSIVCAEPVPAATVAREGRFRSLFEAAHVPESIVGRKRAFSNVELDRNGNEMASGAKKMRRFTIDRFGVREVQQ